jgi:epoxyqueuosine reductase
MSYREDIIKFCDNLGLDTVGFTRCRQFTELLSILEERKTRGTYNEFEEECIEKRINPFLYMHEGKTIVSIAFPYLFEESHSSESGFSRYTMGKDYHKVVGDYLSKVCSFIEELGGKALSFVDSNPLPERYIAYLSGIGFIGKNNMLITEKYGSYVFLGEIITSLEIETDSQNEPEVMLKRMLEYRKCGDCCRCTDVCPTKAINQSRSNPNICLSYITQKKDIEDIWLTKLEGRIFGCDTCQLGCHHNVNITYSGLREFKPCDFMMKPDIEELANIDNNIFREKYSTTSCGWRGKNILQRNVLIGNLHYDGKIWPREIKSAYVKDYYDRLLKLFKL